jgi:hypothetical protein
MANLTGQNIKDTYQELVTLGTGNTITNGTGSVITDLAVTASYATSASYAPIDTFFSSSVSARLTTDESNISANASAIAGLNAETGSYLATGSVSSNVITLEKVDGSSFTLTVDTGSASGDVTALSASLSTRLTIDEGLISGNAAAIIINSNDIASLTAATSSYVTNSQTGSMSVAFAVSSSHAVQADNASTADLATLATNATNAVSASYASNASTADFATAATSASYASNASTADSATSASYASNAELLDGLDSTAFAQLAQNNVFSGNQTFNDITVNGTGSFAYIQSVTGSAKIIGDAFIILNNDTPAERYAGIIVQDSGSGAPNTTASFFFDGTTNDWNYEYSTDGGATVDLGVAMFGPEYNTKGSPIYPTTNTLVKGNGHHLEDSSISDDGSKVTVTNPMTVTSVTASAAIRANGGVITQTVAAVSSQLDLGTLGSGDIYITSAGGDIIVTGSIDTSDEVIVRATGGDIKLRADYPTVQIESDSGFSAAFTLYNNANTEGVSLFYNGSTAASLAGIGTTTLTVTGNLTGNADTATSASHALYAVTASYAANVPQGEATTEVGNILFENIYGEIYGSAVSPLTGNITIDGASTKVDGATAIIYHNDSAEPSISGATVDKKTGTYGTGSLNIITLTNIDGSHVLEYIAGIAAPSTPALTVEESGTPVVTSTEAINFQGSEFTVTDDPSGTAKVEIGGTTSTESTILFDNSIGTVYNTAASPKTGNITLDNTGAKVGASVIIYHQDATEPTVSGMTVDKVVGSYDTSALNMISFVHLGSNHVLQTIAGADVTGIITNSTDTYTSTAEVQHVITCTSAEYAAIGTPDANTFYIVI